MDIPDVSDIPQYFQMLKDQKAKLELAHTRQGQRPVLKPRFEVIMQFQMALMASRARSDMTGTMIKTSFVPPSYPPCQLPLADLKKTAIRDLLLETHHRGTYLLVHTVTPQDRLTAAMAIVEDERGDILMLQLYHQEDDAEDVLDEGRVLILKEPYLKLMSDGNCGLRVDHPCDVVFLSPTDDRIPPRWRQQHPAEASGALAWKTKGNTYFGKGAYRSAIESYTHALTRSPTPDETTTLLLNRSLAHLRAGQFDAALVDASSATSPPPSQPAEKALYRKAEALYHLQRFRECCETLKALRLVYPANDPAKHLLTRAIARLAEQTHGRYPFKQMRADAARVRPPRLDRATYIGPVQAGDAGPRGRGLFTTRAVKAGELLFCEKAFAYAAVDGVGTVLLDSEAAGGKITMGAGSDLIDLTIRGLYRNPSLIPQVTGLHHGAYNPLPATEADGLPIIDSFLIRRTLALNGFGSAPPRGRGDGPQESSAEALHPLASLLNHSCLSTARRAFFGDLLVARAARDLPAGAELTWWYLAPTKPGRRAGMERTWGFECSCALCEEEAGEDRGMRGRRGEVGRGVVSAVRGLVKRKGKGWEGEVVGRIVQSVGVMGGMYKRPAAEVPRLEVWAVVNEAVGLVMKAGGMEPEGMIKVWLKGLEALGFVIEGGVRGSIVVKEWGLVMDGVVDSWMFLRDAYRLAAPELVTPAEEYARAAYRMVFGEDETFADYGHTSG